MICQNTALVDSALQAAVTGRALWQTGFPLYTLVKKRVGYCIGVICRRRQFYWRGVVMRITGSSNPYYQIARQLDINLRMAKPNSQAPTPTQNNSQFANIHSDNVSLRYESLMKKYPWIDSLSLKVDPPGRQLNSTEEEFLAQAKYIMAGEQEWENGRAANYGEVPRIVQPAWDADGYPQNGFIDRAKSYEKQRAEENSEIQSVLERQGITIGADEKMTITVDFNNLIHVSGLADENRNNLVAAILNDSGMGRKLFAHIRQAELGNPENNGTYTFDELSKYNNNMLLKDYTGYSLADLDFREDGVFTPDGENILTVFAVAVKNSAASDETKASLMRTFPAAIRQYQEKGLDSVANMSLSIDFTHGELVDTEPKNGYGSEQRAWLDKLTGLRGDLVELGGYLRELGWIS
jgi:hypothetical protein